MNLSSNLVDSNTTNTSNDIVSEENTTNDNNSVSNTDLNTESNSNTADITSNRISGTADALQSLPEAELGLTNILNILLIAVGVVLILLSIAIFIKLSH